MFYINCYHNLLSTKFLTLTLHTHYRGEFVQRSGRGGSSSAGSSSSLSALSGSRGSRGGRRRLTGEGSSFNSDYYYYMNEGGTRGGSALSTSSGYGPGSSPSRSYADDRSLTSLASMGSMQVDSFEEEDLLYTERFPGKKCAFCNLSERSTLGQGDIVRLKVSEKLDLIALEKKRKLAIDSEGSDQLSDKSPKGSASSLRRKGSRKLTSGDQGEPIDELENIGFTDEPEISLLFETSGNL